MAADFITQVERSAGQVEVRWSPERAAAVLRGVHGRKRRQRWQRQALGALAVVLVIVVGSPRLVAMLRGPHGKTGETAVASAPNLSRPITGGAAALNALPLQLHDGSVARPQGQTSQVRLREDRPGRTVLELAGAAQFNVVHNPQRLFRVETHGLAVEVLGTRFLVEEQGSRVRVTVQEGRVRVLWASHYDELAAGQSSLFQAEPPGDLGPAAAPRVLPPLDEPAPAAGTPQLTQGVVSAAPAALSAEPAAAAVTPQLAVATAAPAAPPRAKTRRGTRPAQAAPATAADPAAAAVAPPAANELSTWQTLAHEGLFEQAYRIAYGAMEPAAHHAAEPQVLREREVAPGELLLLADVARLSHHPADAMAPLARLLSKHAADPRAPLAAFTLGRVLLDDLGRPREAAQSFLRVQQLDPDGPLSQDALAREVEAWSRAGEAASARARALHYVQKYPAGRRLRSVRHFGEIL